MLPNFVKFYKQCIAPEVVRNNIGRNMKCVDPPYIREATDALKEKQHRTLSFNIISWSFNIISWSFNIISWSFNIISWSINIISGNQFKLN
jgi:hypothetical protein